MSAVLEKLKKLLRLSESSNENEAMLAFEKAQEIAMANGIDLGSVSAEDQRTAIENEEIEVTKSTARNFAILILQDNFPVGVASCKWSVWFYGARHDIEFASFFFPFLIRQMRTLWRAKREAFPHFRSEASYYRGLRAGIYRRLHRAAEGNAAWAVVLSTRRREIEEVMADIPKKKSPKRKAGPLELAAGFRDADRVNLNRPLGEKREATLLTQEVAT